LRTRGALAVALLTLAGCGSPAVGGGFDVEAFNLGLRRAKAVTAVHAVLTTQLALRHLLGALAQAAPGGAPNLAALGAPEPAARATYAIDAAAGTGRIDVVTDGRPVVALDLAFAQTATADGLRFDLTRVAGTVEGFALASRATQVTFHKFTGEAGWGTDVDLDLVLTAGADDMRRAVGRLTLPAVPAAAGVVLGSLAIEVPAHQARFDGTIAAASGGTTTSGGLSLDGRREFEVVLDAAGGVALTPVSADSPPELPAGTH